VTETELIVVARVRRLAKSGEAQSIRVGAGLSLAELGSSVGVGATTIYRWESGRRSPHGELALSYASVLDALAEAASA
jgi:DNA-binding XRE family transcriptional regulator